MGLCFIEYGKIKLIVQKQSFLDSVGLLAQIHPDTRILLMEYLHDLGDHAGAAHQGKCNVQFAFIVRRQIL